MPGVVKSNSGNTSTAHSRSTSAGSSSSRSAEDVRTGSRESPVPETNAIPDYSYPVPIVIKNTFLNTDEAWRPSSLLDGFFEERTVRSCVSRLGAPPSTPSLRQSPGNTRSDASQLAQKVVESEGEVFYDAVETLPGLPWKPEVCPPQVSRRQRCWADEPVNGDGDVNSVDAPEALAMSGTYPTVGSMAHFEGNCKPCAFFHTKGCRQGPNCEFCHLCDAGERKKRRKEKIAVLREMRATDPAAELQQQQQQQ
eukprot:CAMPEP_0178400326 /NCGR_PEP_ID=MMETSP0689_2-20121128/15732_1 /TAXON_ID=160604 /ORGANISM="Amphidinium massartii, Strain CS-259" /LENGTH=252 /DNA_ID=CAMNT_0020021119 /DNA_START=103 /DNA_END=861 /DNA_ORIENTATION=+